MATSPRKRKVLGKAYDGTDIILTKAERTRKASANAVKWVAPDDMPDWQVRAVLAGNMCGAPQNVKDRKYCTAKPSGEGNGPPPWRCKKHGGAGSGAGAPKGTQTNFKHGIYTPAVRPEEDEIMSRIEIEALDEEIRFCKLRLRRAMIAEEAREQEIAEITEDVQENTVHGRKNLTKKTKKTLRGYGLVVNRIIGELCRLYAQKNKVIESAVDGDGNQKVIIYLPNNGRETK